MRAWVELPFPARSSWWEWFSGMQESTFKAEFLSRLAVGFCVTSEQSDHVTVWGENALLLLPKTVGFTLMHSKIKNCCNMHFTERSEWQYPILGWFFLMILLEREWKEINLPKLSSTQVSYIFNHCCLLQAHISKEKELVCFIPSGVSQWCEVDGFFWHWDMQKTRGEKQNHGGRWSNYKEEGRWVVSLQS